jgi:hypothetical protein
LRKQIIVRAISPPGYGNMDIRYKKSNLRRSTGFASPVYAIEIIHQRDINSLVELQTQYVISRRHIISIKMNLFTKSDA